MTLKTRSTLAALALSALFAVPALAQDAAAPAAAQEETAAPAPAPAVTAEPAVTPPVPSALNDIKPPEMTPPKQTGPVYNPPPPSGKDWGKLPQEAREQILNEWKSLPEKDREPFIFYRERAMAKLPDSAYSDNPYKPESPEAVAAKAAATAVAPVAAEEKSEPGFFDKLIGGDDKAE
ncbi:MAG TPA: hypothetical protein VGF14_02155 [Alphaproteobacteria bacterium]